MASDGAPSLPPMGGFRRAFLGYRRAEVDTAIGSLDSRIAGLESELGVLSEMVLGREREIASLREALREANERHDRSIQALESVAMRLDEIHAQARRQATRIRMKALQEAVRISGRAEEIAARAELDAAFSNGADPTIVRSAGQCSARELFEGLVEVEIGPLGDFSQLVGFEDAAGRIGATSEISVRKFSEGRATLSMRLDEPVELLRELEERAPMEFRVRKSDRDRVVLDLDDEAEAA
jgi:chromosome segregation ATPase